MKQKYFVIKALLESGGMATLSQLYKLTDVSSWKTNTPFASIRRILQTNPEFYKIYPGLWGLRDKKDEISHLLKEEKNLFTHSYYQGIIIEIGNARKFRTFVPYQDKNKFFLQDRLCDISSLDSIYEFTYPNLMAKAKTVDVVWFNERKMPNSFFEVEHTTGFKNSLNKFYELQDFRANLYIVADIVRKKEFDKIIDESIYKSIKNLVKFADYESIVKQHEKESIKYEMGIS
ncbi:hypothetical protein [Campylobacter corcagiensis]|uniref:Uncharacterized protein n=1 Tax=Campylobacter corcagiensis TaxID=1448857 RepID=A0A7M1LF46_9BACT|nr:hypothetical protein [Campylobacter corcagiensis]QKF64654.1 hypothetical protein CCORG_0797 [Campylobacter corcagiensis]QOQ87178.1 hypothetical protein IMC76_08190 [Campylobacter corcagiensis]